jgi:hypothetical protein
LNEPLKQASLDREIEVQSGKRRLGVGLLAVQMAKSICIESKKKNMTSSEMDAPRGRHSACMVSSVCTSADKKWVYAVSK